jgi:hypothetical protein
MKNQKTIQTIFIIFAVFAFSLTCFAQTGQLLKRTTYKTDSVEFGAGGTVAITGAPNGSISIEGWNKPEIEVSAEIEIQAPTETDLALLSAVDTFAFDRGFNTTRIITVGTFDKDYMKRVAKKFPKNLLGMPFKIDYKIKVPAYCDLNIDGGSGDFSLTGVDGEIFVKFLNSNAKINLVGGSVQATFGTGTVDVTIPTRSWRGRFADILRSGQIENSFSELKPKTRDVKFTEKSISAKAGNGGVALKFTVGDGTLKISALK